MVPHMTFRVLCGILAMTLLHLGGTTSTAGGKVGIYGLRMMPYGLDAEQYNSAGWGGGVRYLKSVSVPQQLGEGTVRIYPQYFQVYLGVGASFDMFSAP